MSELQPLYDALAEIQRHAQRISQRDDAWVEMTLKPNGTGSVAVFLPNDPEYQFDPVEGVAWVVWTTPAEAWPRLQGFLEKLKAGQS